MRSRTLATFALVATAACASSSGPTDTPAPTRSVVRVGSSTAIELHTEAGLGTSTVLAPSADVWAVLPAVFEQLDIPVTRSMPSIPEMGNMGYLARRVEGKRMNSYVDCGSNLSGQLANSYDITLSVVTRLSDGPPGTTIVATTIDAYGEPRTTSGNPVHCQSRAVLERRIAEIVAEKLGVIGG